MSIKLKPKILTDCRHYPRAWQWPACKPFGDITSICPRANTQILVLIRSHFRYNLSHTNNYYNCIRGVPWVRVFSVLRQWGFKFSVIWEYKYIFTVNWELEWTFEFSARHSPPAHTTMYMMSNIACHRGLAEYQLS